MTTAEEPVTRQSVSTRARAWANDPATVVEVPHDGFNSDPKAGGFAFRCDRGLMIETFDGGSCQKFGDPGDDARLRAAIEKYWRETQHRNRDLGLADVSAWHRAAIAALTSDVASVADLPADKRQGVTDAARADHLLVFLQRRAKERTETAALRALAANDWLLKIPGQHDRAHPCPLCGMPAIGEPWQYVSVCDNCKSTTLCSDGRSVTGHNTSIFGGFEAQHVDDETVCEQVTGDGLVWVNGHECRMGEAKFGGVFVGVS